MKKNYLSSIFAITCVVLLGITPINASASGKVPATSTVKTVEAQEKEGTSAERQGGVPGSLTPDGNLNLVDDYGADQRGGKQFITVETKSGKYFYIIIDRDDNGMETVHFLNKVDEEDLLALMEAEAVQEYLADKEVVQTEETIESVVEETEEGTGEEHENEEAAVVGLSPVTGLLLIVGIMGLGGVGGYFYLKQNKKSNPKGSVTEDDEELPIDLNEMELDDEDLDMEEEEE